MKEIINKFSKKKFIPLNEFMNFALYDRQHGYYIKKNPFGKKGDFITSPHVSNLFGEMISIWCVAYWEYLGKPKKIFTIDTNLYESTFASKLLEIQNNYKDCSIGSYPYFNYIKKTTGVNIVVSSWTRESLKDIIDEIINMISLLGGKSSIV